MDLRDKNRKTGLTVLAVVLGMIALSFGWVPLYNLFCNVTGFEGTTRRAEALPGKVIERTVKIEFDAGVARDMPWRFHPERRSIAVRLGEKGLIAYRAENPAAERVTGVAVYNVSPSKAGKYFHKIQCFCFNEQILEAGQTATLPVVFYVDPAMADDPDMMDVSDIVLSYTFFKTGSRALDRAMEEFYNRPDATASQNR